MLTSMFSLFYVTGEFHRFLHRGKVHIPEASLTVRKPVELESTARKTMVCSNDPATWRKSG